MNMRIYELWGKRDKEDDFFIGAFFNRAAAENAKIEYEAENENVETWVVERYEAC